MLHALMAFLCLLHIANCAAAAEPPSYFTPAQREGYFFVGGQYATVDSKVISVGQMFVQYHAPVTVTQPHPVVMVHGTAQTGVNFLGTPDGRPGWVQRFVERGFSVYVVDQVGRGRSGDNPEVYGPYTRFPATALERTFTGSATFGLFPQAKLHTQWPGGPGLRGTAAFDQFYASQVPYIVSALKTEQLVNPAMLALLQRIGPSVLLTHSQAGVFGWALSDQRPDLVKAHVAVEPNGPPFFDVRFKGGAQWWEPTSETRARPYGITRVPLAFDPPLGSPDDLTVVQVDKPLRENQIRCWLQAEPARRLPNLSRVPAVVVTGEASFRATVDDCTIAFLAQAGAKPDRMALGERGIRGNGHMMMLEMNNLEVADAIIDWIEARAR